MEQYYSMNQRNLNPNGNYNGYSRRYQKQYNQMNCDGNHIMPYHENYDGMMREMCDMMGDGCKNEMCNKETRCLNSLPIAMAYVPWQDFGDLYDEEMGLMEGTMFKELNLIFCGVRC